MKRKLLLFVVVLLAAVAGVPYLEADYFAAPVKKELQRALQREVEVGKVRFHLLTGPGFSVDDVVIHEDPAISVEPLAYVSSMVVRLRLLSLLGGKLEFSSLRLEEPSVNLMQTAGGGWNVQALLPSAAGNPPDLEVRNGRVNFKLNGVKSVYYFTNADIDFSSERGNEAFDLWFRGEPARTDRAAQGFGRFTGRGRLLRPEGAESRLELDYQLEPSAVEELAMLLAGRDTGAHGVAESRGKVAGPLSSLAITGKLDLHDLHYWSQPPRPGRWQVGYQGTWNLPNEQFMIATDPGRETPLPFHAAVEVSDYLSATKWKVILEPQEMPLALAVGWLRPEGEQFNELKLQGTLSGRVEMAHDRPAQGKLQVRSFGLLLGEETLAASEEFPVEITEGKMHLHAPSVSFGTEGSGELDYEWRWTAREIEARLQAKPVKIGRLAQLAKMFGERPPLLTDLRGGSAQGTVRVVKVSNEPGVWSGNFILSATQIPVAELREPVKVQQANVELSGERLSVRGLKASVGPISWTGDYRYDPAQTRPHRFDIRLEAGSGKVIEHLLQPALRRERGFMARTLGIGENQVPEWLASRRAEGQVQIGTLDIGGQVFEKVRLGLQWDASRLNFREVHAGYDGGELTGSLQVNLRGSTPQYQWSGKVTGIPWQEGQLEATATGESRGTGTELLRNLRIQGKASAAGVQFGERDARHVRADYEIRANGAELQLALRDVEVEINNELWTGKGTSQRAGKMIVELAATEGRELRLAGTLTPLELQ